MEEKDDDYYYHYYDYEPGVLYDNCGQFKSLFTCEFPQVSGENLRCIGLKWNETKRNEIELKPI